jgi:hypothetical protein
MIQNCNEQILDDIVRIELVPADRCTLKWPLALALTETPAKTVTGETAQDITGEAALTLAFAATDGADAAYSTPPTLRQTEKRQQAGIIVTHELEVTADSGTETVREKAKALQYTDFHVRLTTRGGERYLICALPETASLLIDEKAVAGNAGLKVSALSASHVIRLTE